ncbi:large-conductance mechanosensitive channel protein MscL [Tenacibaculum piscium]|uniref:Large-conductance mechanosensitive channel n=2 Tax=Tenacibaculum piscium TaxID=1458515 RepID=A0A2H1YKJ1_9FLAO|nr:large-conductance mechanosensitive channel protein MscL [Tenacibaculum piscium]MBE7669966.1 large-conductance mechanosensitive channel protein MscL [Tenacibaculum piscium]MBE7685611.1 large-conductance mechanosensitive channel protein MscL [Tenacibaculum piscium]MBE7690195.1 large-conductance mechanosensitive channel protein MscL [Tenacibaculum piscium]SOS76029.1 Large-conductance mechanosensitive channel [Tenacibaculum piscium]
MSMLKEFKEFAMKGNLVDIAVGFVMGAAFKQVVTSFTGGIVSPLIGLLFNADFKDLKYIAKEGVADAAGKVTGEVAILYGEFLTNVIDFVIVAFVMFMVVKGVNALKKKEEPVVEAPKGPSQEDLLAEIRDLLKKQ